MELQIVYDQEADAAYIPLSTKSGNTQASINVVVDDDRIADEIVLDFSESGELLGLEVLSAATILDPMLIVKDTSKETP